MAQVGRISGPLLETNLLRKGTSNSTSQDDLKFRNTNGDNVLLKIDVTNGRIGVDKETPANELHISETTRTIDLIGDTANIGNFEIQNNSISTGINDIIVSAEQEVFVPILQTEQFLISDNYISTTSSNSDIEIIPNGSGSLEIFNNLNVTGNLTSTGNITLDGNITFGDNLLQDTVTFNADIASDVIPDQTLQFDLGTSSKRWDTIYTRLFNGESISTQNISAGGIDINRKVGNIFYVSVNGNDTATGDHPQAPLTTIKEALSRADGSTAGPVTIYVYPGEYQEELPLVVPANTSIVGLDVRNCIVSPDTSSQSKDVFLLNDSSLISNITIKDFYYDSINNTGYAVRFDSDAIITNRSPYLQNITVITHGSVTSESDPRGFDEGDAGKGAYIDGATLNSNSIEASMLFHSCTFITPGVDAITMTNGVRVEWLNSFTYFANRGLYAINGLTGRTTYDGSTVNYGAEVRSIGSASVYGNYGTVVDGSDCLIYLIQHNFGYIGSGKDSSNDDGNIIQENEIVENNSGQVHFVTTDQKGNFRIGDNFLVDFGTGNTSFDISSLEVTDYNNIVITSGPNTTTIGPGTLELSSFFIEDNSIATNVGPINISSDTGTINLLDNTNITGNVAISGDFSYDGNINIKGNEDTDTVIFNVEFEQDFNPNEDLEFKLGSFEKRWLKAHLSKLETPDIEIFDNIIQTKTSNADLELRANGTGNINISSLNTPSTFSVLGTTDIDNVNVNGIFDIDGFSLQTGNLDIAGETTIGNVYIEDNFITTTTGNLSIIATGDVNANNSVVIDNDLTNNNLISLQGTLIAPGDISHTGNTNLTGNYLINGELIVDNVYIEDNFVTSNISNADLELRANGTGEILVPNNNVRITNNLTVSGDTSLRDTNITGTITSVGDLSLSNPLGPITDSATMNGTNGVRGSNNFYVEFNAGISGSVIVNDYFQENTFGRYVYIGNDLTAAVGNYVMFTFDNGHRIIIKLGTPYSPGPGYPTNMIPYAIEEVVFFEGESYQPPTSAAIDVIYYQGKTAQVLVSSSLGTGAEFNVTNLTVDGDIDTGSQAQFEEILFDGNVIQTTTSDSDLELRANGSGIVDLQEQVTVNNNLNANNIDTTNVTVALNISSDNTNIGSIEFNDNYVKTTSINSDLTLSSDRNIIVPSNNVQIENNLTVSTDTNLQNTTITGLLTHYGSYNQTGNYEIAGELTVDNVYVEDNFITTTTGDLSLGSDVSGNIVVDTNNVSIANDLDVDGVTNLDVTAINGTLTQVGDTTQTGNYDIAGELTVDNVYVEDNFITTTSGNLTLSASGTGNINVDTNNVEIAQDLTVSGDTSLQKFVTVEEDSFITLSSTLDNPNAYGTGEFDLFGHSVAISGNYAIVGAYGEDDATGNDSGKAYIYNTTTGTLLHTLDNPNAFGTSENDWFGRAVAISGNRAIVGAYQEDEAEGSVSGKAYIFDVTTGNLLHTLDNPNAFGTSDFDRFGYSVAISGNYAIVGAYQEDDVDDLASGKAYIFDVVTGNLLHTLDNPNAYNTTTGDNFGDAVAISGNYAIVSAVFEDDAGGLASGKAYIFDVTTGSLLQTIDNPNAYGTSQLDTFGNSVAISGDRAIVGARNEDDDGGSVSGKAYIFDVTTGNLLHTLDNPNAYDTPSSDEFGWSVAISGNYAIVGARMEDDAGGSGSGKAYIFDVTTGNLLYTLDNPNAYDTSAGDQFGWSVAISGDYAIVGAYVEDDAGGSASGKSYIFEIVNPTSTILSPVDVNITGTLTHVGDTVQTGNYTIAGEISNGNIQIEDNFITTKNTNSDLELRANGTGNVIIDADDPITVNNNLTVLGTFSYNGSLTIDGDVINSGTVLQEGSLQVGETLSITDDLIVLGYTQFEEILIDDNYITTTSSNANLELRANGTGEIITDKTVDIKNNLIVDNLIEATDILVNNSIQSTLLDTSTINITGNVIELVTNDDFEIIASGTGNIILSSDTETEQNLTINGTSTLNNNVNVNNLLTQTGNKIQTGNINLTGNINSTSLTLTSSATIDQITVKNNFITSNSTNADLELRAAGTGNIVIPKNLHVVQDVAASLLITPNININGTVAIEEFEASTNVRFFDNVITTTESNSNLELKHAGAGSVYLENIEVVDGKIQTIGDSTYNEDIVLSPTENIIINTSSALQIPIGTVENRVTTSTVVISSYNAFDQGFETVYDGGESEDIATEILDFGSAEEEFTLGNLGDIRFNTTDNVFEGTSRNNTPVTFSGLYSSDRKTTVLAHPTNNTLTLTTNNVVVSTISSTNITANKVQIEDITISNNEITTNNSNADLDLRANGTGELVLGDISLSSNTIKDNGNNLIIRNTGFGSTKISGSSGVVVPLGTTGERPVADPNVGDTRWNTSTQILETWDGNQYLSAAGVAAAISEEEFNDLLLEYTLIFG